MPLHIQTPLIYSSTLSTGTGKSIWLKMEALQPTGSFKNRGICYACENYAKQGAQRFITSSGGNAGLATAYAGRQLDIPVCVFVPESTSSRAIDLLRVEKAQVTVHGESWQEANEKALSLLSDNDAFLHPFDDPLVWQGHSTIVDEIHDNALKPDAIVLSVGGGGLLSGVGEGLKKYNWHEIPILAIETEGTASLNKAIDYGNPVELESINSIATSLGAKKICQQAFDLTKELPIQSVLVSDHSAVNACSIFLDDHRILVEPACGASLSIAYDNRECLDNFETIVIIVCGGVTSTLEQIL